MNWGRGFKRAAYFLLGLIWLGALSLAGMDGGAAKVGEVVVYMLVFTIGYLLFCGAVAWVFRGFTREKPGSPG